MSSQKHLQAAGYSIASNIFVQLLSRGLTFILGAISLKYLQSTALLGIINIRLALLYSTLRFLAREPFRKGCIGEAARSNTHNWPKIVNTIWLGECLCIILAIPLSYIWRLNIPDASDLVGTSSEDYDKAVLLVCLAVMIDMIAEPCYIYAQSKALTDHNPRVEVTFMTLRCVLSSLVTIMEGHNYVSGQSSNILTKIACCQVTASIIAISYSYTSIYDRQKLSLSKFLPSMQHNDQNHRVIYRIFDETSLKLSFSFVSNTFLKQLLTEGERYVMTFFNIISLSEQGIYDVTNNLGSLSARLVFKPIEDSGYTLFSQIATRSETLDKKKFSQVRSNLLFMIRCMVLIGITILTLGYNYVPLIVIYGGEKLDNQLAFYLMRWQLFYMPILAINGITECFAFAVMNASEVRGYNVPMILFSMVFLASVSLTHRLLGSACFIFSNGIVMLSRIFFSCLRIRTYFRKHNQNFGLVDISPSLTTIITLAGVFVLLSLSLNNLDPKSVMSVAYSGLPGLLSVALLARAILFHEEDLIDFINRLFSKNKPKK